jgi:hypothetical protein
MKSAYNSIKTLPPSRFHRIRHHRQSSDSSRDCRRARRGHAKASPGQHTSVSACHRLFKPSTTYQRPTRCQAIKARDPVICLPEDASAPSPRCDLRACAGMQGGCGWGHALCRNNSTVCSRTAARRRITLCCLLRQPGLGRKSVCKPLLLPLVRLRQGSRIICFTNMAGRRLRGVALHRSGDSPI